MLSFWLTPLGKRVFNFCIKVFSLELDVVIRLLYQGLFSSIFQMLNDVKFLIFKLVENYHGSHFHMWGRHPNAYVLYIFEKEVLSGSILSSELASKSGHISSYW